MAPRIPSRVSASKSRLRVCVKIVALHSSNPGSCCPGLDTELSALPPPQRPRRGTRLLAARRTQLMLAKGLGRRCSSRALTAHCICRGGAFGSGKFMQYSVQHRSLLRSSCNNGLFGEMSLIRVKWLPLAGPDSSRPSTNKLARRNSNWSVARFCAYWSVVGS